MNETYRYRLGIDIGGTFTDFTLVDTETKTSVGIKTPTVAARPERGIENGLDILKSEYGLDPDEVQYFVHGMTIGLNTLLQRRGSRIALFTTEGFRDILTMQRMRIPVPYDFNSRLPEPLIPRRFVYGIPERFRADGVELVPVDLQAVDAAVEDAVSQGIEGIAICFLHSYQTPWHESEVAQRIMQTHPEIKVCCSNELWSEMREYERACVAVANLYVQKNVETYFENLKEILRSEGLKTKPFITQSNGGIMDLDTAAAAPIKTLFSGPAAGVIGAIREAGLSGEKNLLTFDMGGTSTDVSVVVDGDPTYSSTSELAGFPIALPTVDIVSIGAGGGSIAWIDRGGLLKVGPSSAGSDPGPACYGKSSLPTLTDAFLVCGFLSPAHFAAGRMSLDRQRSLDAIGVLGEQLGKDVYTVADEMVRIAVANMHSELSNVMEQKGFDPRDLSVVAYGGGGPVLANIVADEIHARNVFVPFRPGTLCAMGSLSADFVYDASAVVQISLGGSSMNELNTRFDILAMEAREWLDSQQTEILDDSQSRIDYFVDARYSGQSYEIQIPVPRHCLDAEDCSALIDVFHAEHQRLYGHCERAADVEVVSLKARIVSQTPDLPSLEGTGRDGTGLDPVTRRDVYFGGRKLSADVYERESMGSGSHIEGPAIIEQDDTTTVILPGWKAVCDSHLNICVTKMNA